MGNSFFGSQAGQGNVGGDRNAFFGLTAGLNNSSGDNNAYFGAEAGEVNSLGSENAAFGARAGQLNTGSNNTYLGFLANNSQFTSVTNATAIGNRAQVTESNTMVLGSIDGINGAKC